MTLRQINMIANCEIEIELWNVIEEEYTRLPLDYKTLNKYGEYQVSAIKPICIIWGGVFDDQATAKAKLRVCIDLFD